MFTKTMPISFMKTNNKINIQIDRNRLESLMNAFGLFRQDFLDTLEKSEQDHRAGRITKRKSLAELMD